MGSVLKNVQRLEAINVEIQACNRLKHLNVEPMPKHSQISKHASFLVSEVASLQGRLASFESVGLFEFER